MSPRARLAGALAWAALLIGLRVSTDAERAGLDQTSHGEAAYHT